MAQVATGNNKQMGAILVAIGRTMIAHDVDVKTAMSGEYEGETRTALCEEGIDGETVETLTSAFVNQHHELAAFINGL